MTLCHTLLWSCRGKMKNTGPEQRILLTKRRALVLHASQHQANVVVQDTHPVSGSQRCHSDKAESCTVHTLINFRLPGSICCDINTLVAPHTWVQYMGKVHASMCACLWLSSSSPVLMRQTQAAADLTSCQLMATLTDDSWPSRTDVPLCGTVNTSQYMQLQRGLLKEL